MKFPELIPVYGDKEYRNKKCPSESQEQVTFFAEVRNKYPNTFGKIAYHQRSEGQKTYGQARWQKAEGQTTGASDIIIPGKPSFLCELKRQDHTLCKLSKEQEEYLVIARDYGSFVCIALGWEAAYEAFDHWRKNVLL